MNTGIKWKLSEAWDGTGSQTVGKFCSQDIHGRLDALGKGLSQYLEEPELTHTACDD